MRFTNAIAPLNPLRVNVRVIVLASRRHAPDASSCSSAASSSRVSFSGGGTEQPTEADAEHDAAAEVHERADEKREREDACAKQRARRKWTDGVREAPHREARAYGRRALLGNRRGHEQRLVEWPGQIREEAADHEQPCGDDEDGREHDQSET